MPKAAESKTKSSQRATSCPPNDPPEQQCQAKTKQKVPKWEGQRVARSERPRSAKAL